MKSNVLDLGINLEYGQNNNNNILFVIDSPVLLKKSLFYIFGEISNFFSIIHIISFYSFNSKRIKFTYPPAIFLWMLFFSRHLYFSLLLVIRHSNRITECTLHINGNGKEREEVQHDIDDIIGIIKREEKTSSRKVFEELL